MNYFQTLSEDELQEIKRKRSVRRMLAKKSHMWFFTIYLSDYIDYPFAPFHHEMFAITEDPELKLATIVAFRGSGKSTLMSLSYPIWSIIGQQQKKFVLILGQTQYQARQHLANIKRELETNELLRADVGPFTDYEDEWGSTSIVLTNYNAKITIASTEQSIRGIRHGKYRPDVVICDDVEDLNSVKTKEGRDKIFQWLTGEIMPIGDTYTKKIFIGNLLHEDCLLMRLKNMMDLGKLQGTFSAYPLVDDDNRILWLGKFPNQESIEILRSSIASESAWFREYLLKIISDEDRVVKPEWIQYYDELPKDFHNKLRFTATGIDLAIGLSSSSDCTSMVSAHACDYRENLRIYILPNPINERMDFPTTVAKAKELSKSLGNGTYTKLYIEDVGYQKALIDQLIAQNVPAEPFKTMGQDKRARLTLVTHLIQQGKVLFPRHGAEDLIMQLTGFGIEKHDDLADAFSLLLLKIIEEDNKAQPCITVICTGSIYDRYDPLRGMLHDSPFSLNMKF
jgi:predicted phage terminase large subunit-like protein